MPDQPVYYHDAYAVRLSSHDRSRPAAFRLGLSAAQVEETIARPWRLGHRLVLDGQVFEPDTYTVEIRRCNMVMDRRSPARSYAALDDPPVTDDFLKAEKDEEPQLFGDGGRTAALGENATATAVEQRSARTTELPAPPADSSPVTPGVALRAAATPTSTGQLSVTGTEVSFAATIFGLALGLVSASGVQGARAILFSLALSLVLTALLAIGLGPLSALMDLLRARPVAVWLVAGVCVIAGTAALFLAWPERHPDHAPPSGSVVDARTGQVLKPEPITRPRAFSPSQIEGGDIVRSCNLTADARCLFADSTQARFGDHLVVRARLHNPFTELTYVKVKFTLDPPQRTVAGVDLRLEWPTAGTGFDSVHAFAKIVLGASPDRRLKYVPESSELLGQASERLALLPEDLFSTGGAVLKHVGAPRGCVDCDLDYVRFVQFQLVVT